MKITSRRYSDNLIVGVEIGNSFTDLGFLDVKEVKSLRDHLLEAISDLEWFIQTQEK